MKNNKKTKRHVLIVDDEPLALQSIKMALANFNNIEIIGECTNGFDAISMCLKFASAILIDCNAKGSSSTMITRLFSLKFFISS